MKCLMLATLCLLLLFSATIADIGLGQQSSVGLGQQQPAVSSNLQGSVGMGGSRILRWNEKKNQLGFLKML